MHVGLIGGSGFGRQHLAAMQASPHVSAVSLAGRSPERLAALQAEFPKVVRTTVQYQELLADPEIALLDLVVPHDLHLPLALEALRCGKHLLLEKPPARTTAEFRQILTAAEAADRRVLPVLNLLYSPTHQAARQVVDSGAVGEPFLALEVAARDARAVYADPENWRADRERCGGGLQIDGGFHAVYRQLFFLERLGAPVSVLADAAQIGIDSPEKGEDFCALTLAYGGGARIHLMSQWTARAPLGRFPSGILGTEGTLLFTGDAARPLVLRRPGKEDAAVPVEEGPEGFEQTVRVNLAHLLECAATGAAVWAGSDLAMLTLEIITAAYRSAEEGRRIALTGSFRTRFPEAIAVVSPGDHS
ncbi:MAG: Gfo/Idh/MocA family protein [Armatimonadota bacterium]